jgi:hypothetical protein
MNDVLLDDLKVFCYTYLDDIIIYSDDPIIHKEHTHLFVGRLEKTGLQVGLKKC